MAAPIRVRISEVIFDNNNFTHLIDPFWLLISDDKYTTILDVKKKIILICKDAFLSQRKGSQINNLEHGGNNIIVDDEDDGSDFKSEENPIVLLFNKCKPETSACQLWLEGCRLLDTEHTAILRENDSLTVKFNNLRNKTKPDIFDSHTSQPSSMRVIIQEKDGSKRNDKPTNDLSLVNNRSEFETSTVKKEKRAKKKRKLNNDRMVSDEDEEVNEGESHQKKKKKKRKKEKECIDTSVEIEDVLTDRLSGEADKHLQRQQDENDKLEKLKQNMLSYLDSQASKLDQCLNITNDSLVAMSPDSNDKEMTSPDILMPEKKKRTRRRKTKRAKRLEETLKVVRVEDKPRSSILNLPWDQQPQNTKMTFDSDTEKLEETVDSQHESMLNGCQNMIVKDIKNRHDLQSQSNGIDGDINKPGPTSSSVAHNERVEKKYQGKSVLSNMTRKYMMRSTMSILDSLKSANSSDNNKKNKTSVSLAVTNASHGKSISPSSFASAENLKSYKKPIATSLSNIVSSSVNTSSTSDSNCLVDSSNGEPKGIPTTTISAGIARSFINGSPNGNADSDSLSTLNEPLRKSSRQASVSDSSLVGTYVDSNAKFSELLQRRKFNNGTCTVSTTRSGVTLCSRQKSPRGKNAFADPSTDVLTNKSTVVNGYGENVELSPVSKPTTSLHTNKSTNGSISINNVDSSTLNVDAGKVVCCDKVEVMPVDFENCPLLSGGPQKGDVLAYKVLEMTDDYTPAVSNFKIGKVLGLENDSVSLEVFGNSVSTRKGGKFELCYDDEDDVTNASNSNPYEQVFVSLGSMMDTRLVTRGHK